MTEADAKCLAYRLMTEFNLLPHWEFRFNRARQEMGRCVGPHRGKPGRIELSRHYVALNGRAVVEDTLRHEIAHALAGPEKGHGAEWVAACRVTGASPQRLGVAKMPAGRFVGKCPGCGQEFGRYRAPAEDKSWHCRGCGPDLGKIVWARAAAP